MGIVETQTLWIGGESPALLDDPLCQWVTRTIEIRIIDILADAIWAEVNLLFGKRVLDKSESGLPILELGEGLEIESCQFPQPVVELIFDFIALTLINPKLLVNLFIEVFKKFLPSLLDAFVNL